MARNARGSARPSLGYPQDPVRPAGGRCEYSGAAGAAPATTTGIGTAASARRSGGSANRPVIAPGRPERGAGGGGSLSREASPGEGRMTTRACRVCGRVDRPGSGFSHGRCQMCAIYWRRHGVDRPPQPPRPPATLRPCTHCGRLTWEPRRGRCDPCYRYWYRSGIERPLGPRPPRPCQTCGQLVRLLRRGRCPACYMYWYRHGVERPLGPRPPPPLRPCQTCARLVPAFHQGRCPACYSYWYRTGRERPPARWQRREG